ncbi:hypothetical protein [Myxosarcina sp. GI1(2024)]
MLLFSIAILLFLIYAQVAEEIRQAILQGRLKPEQKLSSSHI